MSDYAVVVPTIGRPSLAVLLASLAAAGAPRPARSSSRTTGRVADAPLDVSAYPGARVVRSGGRGPAAARNTAWRATSAPWVVTLDDDVVLPDGWSRELAGDLAGVRAGRRGRRRAASSSRCPRTVRPTDWERSTAGLERARWATADMAFAAAPWRRSAGSTSASPAPTARTPTSPPRLRAAGRRLVQGDRHVLHPVRPAGRWVSVRVQRGNADDALMRAVHGRDWRGRAGVRAGPVAAGTLATVGAGLRRGRRPRSRPGARAAAAGAPPGGPR